MITTILNALINIIHAGYANMPVAVAEDGTENVYDIVNISVKNNKATGQPLAVISIKKHVNEE